MPGSPVVMESHPASFREAFPAVLRSGLFVEARAFQNAYTSRFLAIADPIEIVLVAADMNTAADAAFVVSNPAVPLGSAGDTRRAETRYYRYDADNGRSRSGLVASIGRFYLRVEIQGSPVAVTGAVQLLTDIEQSARESRAAEIPDGQPIDALSVASALSIAVSLLLFWQLIGLIVTTIRDTGWRQSFSRIARRKRVPRLRTPFVEERSISSQARRARWLTRITPRTTGLVGASGS